jgi:hypothetical protein
MRETACRARHTANPRGDTWNAYTWVNGDRPALGSFSDLAGFGQPGGCPKAEPSANHRRQAGLPGRLPELLLKRPDRRLRVAGVPEAKCTKPFGTVPSGGGRDRQSGAGSAESEIRNCANGTATTPPGTAAPAAPAARTYATMSPRQKAMLLRGACGMDYRTYCSEVPIGGGRVIECLRENGPSLSRQCRSVLLSARQER